MAFASDSAALAVLEVLVHLDTARVLPAYSMIAAEIPDSRIEDLDPRRLLGGWWRYPPPPETQAIGDAWIASRRSLALRVPSALLPGGATLLISLWVENLPPEAGLHQLAS